MTDGTSRNQAHTLETPPDSVLGSSSAGWREVSPKRLVPNIIEDQKPIWLFPLNVLKGEHLKPTLVVAGATAGLVALDPYDEPTFATVQAFKALRPVPCEGETPHSALL